MSDVSREAQDLLDQFEKHKRRLRGFYGVLGFFIPLAGIAGKAGLMLAESLPEDEYIVELRKAARGERSTLPEPPPFDPWVCVS